MTKSELTKSDQLTLLKGMFIQHALHVPSLGRRLLSPFSWAIKW